MKSEKMKKLLGLLVSAMLVFMNQFAGAQCTVNTSNTTNGFTPTSLPCIDQWSVYGQPVQFRLPYLYFIGDSFAVNSITITSVTGMPTGITYSTTPSGSFPGGIGCFWFSGATSDAVGNYPLTFNVIINTGFGSDTGTLNNLVHDSITLTVCAGVQTPPVSAFGWSSTTTCDSVLTQFRDSSTNTPSNWMWTFQGGTPSTSNLKNPVVTFYSNGPHNVKLVVSNPSGTDSITKTDIINIGGFGNGTLNVSASGSACSGRTVLGLSGDTAGAVYAVWRNGTMVVDTGLTYQPQSAGMYRATEYSAYGCNKASDSVTVYPGTDSINILASAYLVCPGGAVLFTAVAGNGGNNPSYQWQLNGADAGTNADTFTVSNANYGDVISVSMNSSIACALPNPATKSMNVNVFHPEIISIGNACEGHDTLIIKNIVQYNLSQWSLTMMIR